MPVHLGAVGVAAAHVGHGLAVKALAEDLQDLPLHLLVPLVHDPGLDVHHQLGPADSLLGVHPLHLGGGGPLLRGVGEHAGPEHPLVPQELAQLLELRLPLAGQAGDEAGAEDQAGDALPELVQQLLEVRLVPPAVHPPEDAVVAVLEGDVQVFDDLLLPGDDVDEMVVDHLRVEVVEADPAEGELHQLLQQVRQVGPAVPVGAVAGDVLGDDDELLDAPLRQGPGLLHHVLHGAAAVPAPELGDDAEGAPVVAALGDAEVGVPGRGGEDPAELVHRGVDVPEAAGPLPGHDGLHRLHDVPVAAGAQHAVHLGQLLRDLLPVALRHAPGDQDLFQLPLLLQRRHAEDVLDGLLVGAGEKAAGVDHRHVGTLRRFGQGVARLAAQGHHLLAVDHVFLAAQGDEMDVI